MELVYTNASCTGCNKCVRSCPVLTANIATEAGKVMVDSDNVLPVGPVLMPVLIRQEIFMMIRRIFSQLSLPAKDLCDPGSRVSCQLPH